MADFDSDYYLYGSIEEDDHLIQSLQNQQQQLYETQNLQEKSLDQTITEQKNEQSHIYSADDIIIKKSQKNKHSTNSKQSSALSKLSSSQGFILQNPDGGYCQLKPIKKVLSATLSRKSSSKNDNNQEMQIISDSDILFYPPQQQNEIPYFVDDVLGLYQKHASLFKWFLFVQIIAMSYFLYEDIYTKQETLQEMLLIYAASDIQNLEIIYWTLLGINSLSLFTYVLVGSLALYKKSFKLYNWFMVLALLGMFFEIILAYINKFNILMFFMRILSYIYAKFLSQIIASILIIPR